MHNNLRECDHIWLNARIASMDPAVDKEYGYLENYALGTKDGLIHTLVPMSEVSEFSASIPSTDLHHQWVTPGLIDPHTHLVFAGNRANEFEQRLQGVDYQAIAKQGGGIQATVKATRELCEAELYELAKQRLQSWLQEGVTTIEIKSGYGLTLADELKQLRVARQLAKELPIRVKTTLLAAHALPPEYQHDADAYIDFVCNTIIPAAVNQGLVDAVDVFCETVGFSTEQSQRVLLTAEQFGLSVKIHAEQLSNQQGAAMAASLGALSADHLEYLDEEGVKAMQAARTVAVLLPGAFYFLREKQLPPVELLRQYQVPIALASDFNPGTSPLASLRLMLNMACTLFRLTPAEALAGVTRHAAQALGIANECGMIKVGMKADFCCWGIDHPAELAYMVGTYPLRSRILGGQVVSA
ncbi:imidazolonepropionase [Zooshikella sp. RANM57]|uniref:imidazolonepropionase n=1 Tax=Zooshikella sp. RANM57 TaxID=3425863 RepID=UPI003D6F0D0F